jgi:hypothetical protein
MKTAPHAWLYTLCLSLTLPLGCKDESPCDDDQNSIGPTCFAKGGTSSGGTKANPEPSAGAPTDGGDTSAGGETSAAGDTSAAGTGSDIDPPGNPDAMFGTTCMTNADCGGPAPVCATDPLFYCSQIDCQAGEENEGVCPAGWQCFKYQDNPAICVNF